MRIWEPTKNFTHGTFHEEKISKPENFSAETIVLVKKILTAHLLEQVRIQAFEEAKKLKAQLERGNFSHFFTRLGGILSGVGKKNIRAGFKERLEKEIRGGTLFKEHLDNFYMSNGQKFFDVFTGEAPFPLKFRDLTNASAFAELKEAIGLGDENFSEDEIYLEYLTNYFRFARKLAAASGGDDRE